jgi:hypothetical protein
MCHHHHHRRHHHYQDRRKVSVPHVAQVQTLWAGEACGSCAQRAMVIARASVAAASGRAESRRAGERPHMVPDEAVRPSWRNNKRVVVARWQWWVVLVLVAACQQDHAVATMSVVVLPASSLHCQRVDETVAMDECRTMVWSMR